MSAADTGTPPLERWDARPARLDSVDLVRGVAMVLMVLDHVRHFFSDALAVRATNLGETSAALFLTRWITHFCAPVFVFLAGTGVFLSTVGPRAQPREELSRFLVTRGLWLILLELTVVRCLGWTFNADYHYAMAGVLWALGWSMIVLAALIHLPMNGIVGIGIAMIALHNLTDGVKASTFGPLSWLWKVLHTSRQLEPSPGVHFKIGYPLIPWIGVMAAGYGFGQLLLLPAEIRRKRLLQLGLGLVAAFLVIRGINLYGDTHRWSAQPTALFTIFSFVNCDKYPASLLFLLMTLGPAIGLLAVADAVPPLLRQPLVTFGRVPLFFYLLHLPLIHLLAVGFAYARHGQAGFLFENPPGAHGPPFPLPDGYGYWLPVVYAIWLAVVAALFPACLWFARVKQRRRSWWLGYL